ncbi:MAG TPA: class I SAM-dependent methyltransferase, partial [Deltaproteobacteria bacterium]|nr:class I SAM-dependent methyltransferase [Deltaproteobacteria bacterium]
MGLIFDENSAAFYESWRRSSQSRTIERSLEQLVISLMDPEPGERILDIGCGTGNHLLMFNKLGLNVSGVDASPHMMQEAKSRLGHRSTIKMGMAEDLPFDDNEFDLAVLVNTLEFLDKPLLALREAGRVASRKVFIGVLNSLSWNGILKRIQGYFGDPLFGQTTFYNLWQIKSLLQLA